MFHRSRADEGGLVPRGWRHLAVLPFEALFGAFAAGAGILALAHYGGTSGDAVAKLLPSWMNTGVQLMYALSGVAILAGLFKPRRDVEALGLCVLAGTTAARTFAVMAVAPLDLVLVSVFFNALLVACCAARLRTIFRREVISVLPRNGVS